MGTQRSRYFDKYPGGMIIQGGMGVGVSSAELAGAVSGHNPEPNEFGAVGTAGTVSGTATGIKFARTLQRGGERADVLRATMADFPRQDMLEEVYARFPEVQADERGWRKFHPVRRMRLDTALGSEAEALAVMGSYYDVKRARAIGGEDAIIGTNQLMKIPRPIPATVYGAMMAGADYIASGAGNPDMMPRLVSDLATGQTVEFGVKVAGAHDDHYMRFDPSIYNPDSHEVSRPELWAIASQPDLARHLASVGAALLIYESSKAGGHNAPITGDEAPIEAFLDIGIPVAVAGGEASRGLRDARRRGAYALQAGSVFALTQESGMEQQLKMSALMRILRDEFETYASDIVSPTGFPFWVSNVPGTISDVEEYEKRLRVCDIEMLATPFVNAKGEIEYRCPAEPEHTYKRKVKSPLMLRKMGGAGCLCNGLFATIGMGQKRKDSIEKGLLTLGGAAADDVRNVVHEYRLPLTASKVTDFIATRP